MNTSNKVSDSSPQYTRFDEMSPQSRSFYQRTLGKMEAGALRAAIFALISTAIGSGCLTLPLVLDHQGILLGVALLIFTCSCSYIGIMNITSAAEEFKCYEYSGLVEKVLGKIWKRVFDVILVVYVLGSLIGYQVMIGFFVPSIFESINISFDPNIERSIIMVAANIVVMTPLGLLRKLTSLRFMSILSALTLVFIALLIICEFPFFAEHNDYSGVEIIKMNLSVIPSFNICLYAFTCHTNVAQVYDELQRRNLKRMNKVATRAMLAVLVPYIALAIFGYLSTLDKTPNIIIMRNAPRHISNDWLMVMAKIMMSITLIISVPINIPPCRKVIIKSFLKIQDEEPPFKMYFLFRHMIVTIIILWITLIVAIFYPNILVLFSVLGGVCCGTIVLILPSLLRIKAEGWEDSNWKAIGLKYGSLLLFCLGTTGAVLSVAGLA